jgi:hypothetical protein
MFGDGRLRYAGMSGQRMDGQFSITGQALKDRSTRGISEGLEQNVWLKVHANP